MRLGAAAWDARHDTAAFQLTVAQRITYVRNKLMFWRRETVGVKVDKGVDEIALGFLADAHSRTEVRR